MTLLRSLFLAVAVAATAACGAGSTLPEDEGDLAGTLTEFLMGPAYLGAPMPVMVERDLAEPNDRMIVHVGSGIPIYRVGRGGRLLRASRDDLAVGDRLQVWTTGVELRSYPGQVTATRIYIIR